MTASTFRFRDELVPRAIVALGWAFFLSIPAQWIVFDGLTPLRFLGPTYLVSLLTGGLPALGIVYGGYRLGRGDLPPERYSRIATWCVGGSAAFLAVNLVIIVAFPADTLRMNVGWAIGTAIYGAVGGLLTGSIEARAIERAREAERAAVEAERAQAEREWFDYLNGLLRHEVLNTANVIEGQAVLLAEELDDGDVLERLGSIRRQSRSMARVVDDIRVLIRATEDADDFRPVRLADVIETEVRALEDTYEGIEVDVSVPGNDFVLADDLLPRVFSNLLHNAVEHNDAPVPRIQVRAETTSEAVVVEVSDNGPGVHPDAREGLFERTRSTESDHGLGLYLVRTLIERYGGSIELAETGPEGSTFRVDLPLAPEAALEETERVDPLAADGDGR